MKMNFLRRNKPARNGLSAYVWIIIVFILLSCMAFIFPRATRTVFTTLARPLWVAHDGMISDVNFIGNYFVSKNALLNENAALHMQVTALQLTSADYDALTAENQELKSMLGRNEIGVSTLVTTGSSTAPTISVTPPNATDRILARILAKPPQSPYDTFVLDAGSADGVLLGRKVFMSDTLLVGIITDVTPHTALVTLFSADGQKTTAENSRTGASFELDGQGGANFALIVPKDTDILWGDTFVYPALSSEIMASVYYVDTPSGSSFKTIYLRITQNIFSAQWVFVEK